MTNERMPKSLLRNKKTVTYLETLFKILPEKESLNKDYASLKMKIVEWLLHYGPNRFDMTAAESGMFEEYSHKAYDLVRAKKELNPEERTFVEQHEFFFKN